MSPFIMSALLMSLGLGTTITFMSSNWIMAWLGLEINTLAIIPLMTKYHHPRATEAATKYFLTQASASALLLFSGIMKAWLTGDWNIFNSSDLLSSITLTMAIALKLGLAPTHFWLPEVMQGLDLVTGLILATWQKLAPFILMIQITNPNNYSLIVFLGLLSTLAGGWGGLNQTQLRKILAYSSIAHLGWTMVILPFSTKLAMLYIFLYIMMTSALFLILKLMDSTSINLMSISWTKAPLLMALTSMILLSLGGLPPLTGFIPKWLILQELSNNNLNLLALLMAISALLSLFFYLRLCYSATLTTPPNINNNYQWRSTQNSHPLFSPILIISVLFLPITPSLVM
uniref:NADH-ubiquinone oxidoreductase chain 2 n=1 Tax=Lepidosiren paradoxus TaxID=7883 RepID=Q8WDT9_LEPPA|nr:NADH dehydrogenase subunit 2 [Lepidosiren paradoxa]AAL55250.1 NADH dehydrogenase subunit 2 [Lepidosiren paradoxa]